MQTKRRRNKNQKEVLKVLSELGYTASIRQIAEKTSRSVNGVSQTLGSLTFGEVRHKSGEGADSIWELRRTESVL